MKLRTSSVVATTVVAVLGLGFAFLAARNTGDWLAVAIGLLFGLPALWIVLFGMEWLQIDVLAGAARFHAVPQRGSMTLPASELGELYIDVELHRKGAHTYRLYARGLDKRVLLSSMKRSKVEARKARIESLASASLIRPLLAVAHGDGGFRSPDVLPQVRQAVPDDERLLGALALLARDHDPTVRANAAVLATASR